MFEEYTNKKVRVIKTDGFTKIGKLILSTDQFIKLEFDTDKTEYVAIKVIANISQVD